MMPLRRGPTIKMRASIAAKILSQTMCGEDIAKRIRGRLASGQGGLLHSVWAFYDKTYSEKRTMLKRGRLKDQK